MKKAVLVISALFLITAGVSAQVCDINYLCNSASDARLIDIPTLRGKIDALQLICSSSWVDTAETHLGNAVQPVKDLQTHLCASTPNLSEALIDASAARDYLRLVYTSLRRANTMGGCAEADVADARDFAYDLWKSIDYIHFKLEYDCP